MAEKVAILTDIHGNAPALRAVLADLDTQPEIAHTYCLGDMVNIGPDSNEVLELLCARRDLTMLVGNHDQYVLALATGRDPGVSGDVKELSAFQGNQHRRA